MPKKPEPADIQPISPGLRRYLYFTAALTGAAIMVIEILGAKMLAPFMGTSHFVWTAQIAVTLIALATGYYAGGRLVDRSQRLGRVYWAILCAAVYLCLTVVVVEPVAYWCLDFNLAVGSLLASLFLFFAPLALLAVVGPFFVRVLTLSVAVVGGNVGRLTAVSTIGSFAGTILIGYLLIPFMPNSVTMYCTAAALMAVAAGYALGWRTKEVSSAPMLGVTAIGLALGGARIAKGPPANANWQEIYHANSNFGNLQVISLQHGTLRAFLNDYLPQNVYDPATRESASAFTYALHGLACGYAPRTDDVLCIGLGVGIVPMQFAEEGSCVEVVEINPAVVPMAKKFFDLDLARLRLVIDDGRHFINRCTNHYDAIILDAFLGEAPPSHLMSREAFSAMRRLIKPDGVLVINAIGETEPGKDFLAASLEKTLRSDFRNVRIHTESDSMFFVASDQQEMSLRKTPDPSTIHPACRQQVSDAFVNVIKTDPRHGLVLTDDYNPVEYFDAPNREASRRQLAFAMRGR